VKKHVFYGKKLDTQNLTEELGDLFWYIAIMANRLGVSFEDIQERNIKKLNKRFSNGFSEKEANEKKDHLGWY
jgi:NTP pyrophosphatase (non-canonical NTP hydrolase)